MENNLNNHISIEDFLDLYPKLSIKNDFSSPTDNYLKFFNIKNRYKRRKSSIIIENSQINKIINAQNKSRISSININSNEIITMRKIDKTNINKNNKNNKLDKNNHSYALYKIVENEEIDKCIDLENEDLFLINKGIELQKRGLKRSNDVKKALESFFHKSELIEKLSKDMEINNQEIENDNNNDNKNIIQNNLQYKIKLLISKLVENVMFEKYEKNKFIIKMNDIGKDCYFLISGKLSILKPVEYKHIEITYDDYFKYLLNLLEKKENDLLKKVLELNWHFINIYDEDNLLSLIKYYIQNKISVYSNISFNIYEREKTEDLTLEKIEFLLNEYKLKFETFGLSKEKIITDLNNIIYDTDNKHTNIQLRINTYFRQIFKPSRQSQILLNSYNYLFEKRSNNNNIIKTNDNNNNKNHNFVTLYKYENFMFLEPGAFFGEMSLENENKKRNASIRTEEDSILVSLSIEQYENLLLDDNKKLKILQVNFLCNNFFFKKISPKLFIKYYYPMFKLITKKKNEIIYQQESPCNSLFLLKEGAIKYEIHTSIVDIHDLIHFLINSLQNDENLKLESDYIKSLKDEYLINNNLITFRNNNIILREKIYKKYKFELSISNAYEVLGIQDYFLKIGHICTCHVVSKNAKFFEISKNSLNKIISIEKEIINDYFQLALNKILALIKRLFNIENIFVKQTQNKINTNFFEINDTNFFIDLNEEKKLNVNYDTTDKYNLNLNNDKNEEEKNKSNINLKKNNGGINNKDEFILSKEFGNYGHIEESIILRNKNSQIKFENEKKNIKSLKEMKNYENNINNSIGSSSKLIDLKKNKKNKYFKKDKSSKSNKSMNNNKNKRHNFYDLEYKNDKINSSKIKSKLRMKNSNSFIFENNIPKTIINIGNSYLSLPKLKRKLLSNRKNMENKSLNLSIVKNDFRKKIDSKESKSNILNNSKSREIYENISKNKSTIFYSKDNYLPNIKDSPGLNSFVNKMKNNISKIKNSSEPKISNSKEINIYQVDKKDNILAKYIKDFYQKRKNKGYSAFINPYSNTMMKHKLLNNNIQNDKK